MDRSDIIYLVEYNQEQDSLGIWHKNIIKSKVFCQVVSVNQTEWYEGSRKGLNPQFLFFQQDPLQEPRLCPYCTADT